MGFYLSILTTLLYISENLAEKFIIGALTGVASIILLSVFSWINKNKGKEEGIEHDSTSGDDRPQKKLSVENIIEAGKHVFTNEGDRETPSLPKQVKKESVIAKPNNPQRVSSNMNIDQLNKEYILSLLREKCHPRLFMQPYDYEKVNVANRLYSSLKDDCSLEELNVIITEATDKLQVTIDTSQIVAELCAACSPENFMDPYDAEKISIANELYSRILANRSNIIELVILKKDALDQGIIIAPEPKEKATITETPDTGYSSVTAPIKQDIPKIPRIIVNYWKSQTGSWVRLAQYVDHGLYYLETKTGDTWEMIATMVKTKGEFRGGFGSEYVDSSSRLIVYSISRWSGDLIEIKEGVASCKWKLGLYPYSNTERTTTETSMAEEEKEKDETIRSYYNYGSE